MLKSKTCLVMALLGALIGLNGCSAFIPDPDPTEYMSRVKIGMTRADVEDHLGPPDGNWGPWHSQCTEYAFKKHGVDRYSVYYNNQNRVVFTEHAACNVARAREVGLR
ncbi:outer membrane protein assembly factor BamE (plasmid) [Caballeronia sp. NK8]|uniref:outer membrane protein assembly factor BamE domain-containing protein n=1 Tax=Caballeronia sp. NK8 TaxID=140098 RepID=UPI001BB7C7E8|nr:outer membrane protein assembly factor BamE [Caballeronia sp. NK8]BCQ27004.1 outer membrane protein assembly factor BamE [Caballeronia sp. NK8]